jgi:peptide/nickel transport system permease protein
MGISDWYQKECEREVQLVAETSLSQGALAWSRFKRDRVGKLALTVTLSVILVTVASPLILLALNLDAYVFYKETVDPATGGLPVGVGGISAQHPFGVEPGTGRDIMARLLTGMQISLVISLSATAIAMVIGVVLGLIAGYFRGLTDKFISSGIDLMLAFPILLLILSLSNAFTQRLVDLGIPPGNPARITYIVLVLSLFGWPIIARVIRGQVMSIREKEFVEASIAMGAGPLRIMFQQILPNLWAPIIIYASLTLPSYIATEATLSFLGVGVLPPTPTWGAMLADSVSYFRVVPTYLLFPGLALFLVVLSFNLLGDSIRDALDPKGNK